MLIFQTAEGSNSCLLFTVSTSKVFYYHFGSASLTSFSQSCPSSAGQGAAELMSNHGTTTWHFPWPMMSSFTLATTSAFPTHAVTSPIFPVPSVYNSVFYFLLSPKHGEGHHMSFKCFYKWFVTGSACHPGLLNVQSSYWRPHRSSVQM